MPMGRTGRKNSVYYVISIFSYLIWESQIDGWKTQTERRIVICILYFQKITPMIVVEMI